MFNLPVLRHPGSKRIRDQIIRSEIQSSRSNRAEQAAQSPSSHNTELEEELALQIDSGGSQILIKRSLQPCQSSASSLLSLLICHRESDRLKIRLDIREKNRVTIFEASGLEEVVESWRNLSRVFNRILTRDFDQSFPFNFQSIR